MAEWGTRTHKGRSIVPSATGEFALHDGVAVLEAAGGVGQLKVLLRPDR